MSDTDKLEKVTNIIKQFKDDLKKYEKAQPINKKRIGAGLVGVKINEILKILDG